MDKKNWPVSQIGQFSFGWPKKIEIDHTIDQPNRMTKTKCAPLKLQTVHKNFFKNFQKLFPNIHFHEIYYFRARQSFCHYFCIDLRQISTLMNYHPIIFRPKTPPTHLDSNGTFLCKCINLCDYSRCITACVSYYQPSWSRCTGK